MQIALFRDVTTGSLVEISEEPAAYILPLLRTERGVREKFKKEEKLRKAQKGPG